MRVLRVISVAMMLIAAMTIQLVNEAFGQAYPSKPIRIVTAGLGGGSDLASRLIASGLSAPLGQQLIIDNRPSGVIPGDTVAKSAPDGYTILFSSSSLWIGGFLENVPYDALTDFSPITLANTAPYILIVHPSVPVKSVKELVALARARPGELNYGSTGFTSAQRLTSEFFKLAAKVKITEIPFKSVSALTVDLLSGQIQVVFYNGAAAIPYVNAGRLRALGVTSPKPSPLFPGVPTVASTGLPGFESVTLFGFLAPAKTPGPVITRLNQEIVRVLQRADLKEKFFEIGVEPVGSSSGEFATAIKADRDTLGKVIADAGLRTK